VPATARFRRVGLRHALLPGPETSDTAFPSARRSTTARPAREPISCDSGAGLTAVCSFVSFQTDFNVTDAFDLFAQYIHILIYRIIIVEVEEGTGFNIVLNMLRVGYVKILSR